MNNKLINLNEDDALKYYFEMINVFKKFINNNKEIFNYGIDFDWNKILEIRKKMLLEYELNEEIEDNAKKELKQIYSVMILKDYLIKNKDFKRAKWLSIPDKEYINSVINDTKRSDANKSLANYYFKYNNNLYTLDIYDSIDDFGYNEDYYRALYGNEFDNLYGCTINLYRNYIEREDTKLSIDFIYNKNSNQVVDILDICRYSIPRDDTQIIRTVKNGKILEKILTTKNS